MSKYFIDSLIAERMGWTEIEKGPDERYSGMHPRRSKEYKQYIQYVPEFSGTREGSKQLMSFLKQKGYEIKFRCEREIWMCDLVAPSGDTGYAHSDSGPMAIAMAYMATNPSKEVKNG